MPLISVLQPSISRGLVRFVLVADLDKPGVGKTISNPVETVKMRREYLLRQGYVLGNAMLPDRIVSAILSNLMSFLSTETERSSPELIHQGRISPRNLDV